jgi:TetR/AcrR family transcriptional regulator, cholesterol catabolism regulator
MSALSLDDKADGDDAEASKRERKKRDKEARIRAAALALFREKGYAETTTREVAERAGIATGTLFLYVKNKEELVDFVFTGEIAAVVEEAFRTLPRKGDVVARLIHLFGALYDYYAADVPLARVLIAGVIMPAAGARSMPLTFQFLDRVGAVIRDAQKERQIHGDAFPLELASHAFSLYVGGLLALVNSYGSATDSKNMLRRALEIHLSGLRLPPPKSPRRRS